MAFGDGSDGGLGTDQQGNDQTGRRRLDGAAKRNLVGREHDGGADRIKTLALRQQGFVSRVVKDPQFMKVDARPGHPMGGSDDGGVAAQHDFAGLVGDFAAEHDDLLIVALLLRGDRSR